jgi:hypothetical protein
MIHQIIEAMLKEIKLFFESKEPPSAAKVPQIICNADSFRAIERQADEVCHPNACETCLGNDEFWDENGNIIPCPDKSWCQSYIMTNGGFRYCSLKRHTEGEHQGNETRWRNEEELNEQ